MLNIATSGKTVQVLSKVVGVSDLYAWGFGNKEFIDISPKTVKKLLNSINAQFPVADPNSTIQALKDHGIITVDDKGHVKWDALTIEDVLS